MLFTFGVGPLVFFFLLFILHLSSNFEKLEQTDCIRTHTHTQADAPYTGVLCAMWDATVQLTDAAQWRLISEHVAITHTHTYTLILFTAFTVVFQTICKYLEINCYYDVDKGGGIKNVYTYT